LTDLSPAQREYGTSPLVHPVLGDASASVRVASAPTAGPTARAEGACVACSRSSPLVSKAQGYVITGAPFDFAQDDVANHPGCHHRHQVLKLTSVLFLKFSLFIPPGLAVLPRRQKVGRFRSEPPQRSDECALKHSCQRRRDAVASAA